MINKIFTNKSSHNNLNIFKPYKDLYTINKGKIIMTQLSCMRNTKPRKILTNSENNKIK